MTNKRILGIILVVVGIIFLLNRLDVFTVDIFFKGWWTLLLIIPAFVSMSKNGVTLGNTILLVIGVILLLDAQGLNFEGYLLPAVLVVIGIGLLFKR
ncbi:MAG: DUF5668 domain-containing protein [Candidatus Izemoplasmatales bacterium]|jgi:hypothetical protein